MQLHRRAPLLNRPATGFCKRARRPQSEASSVGMRQSPDDMERFLSKEIQAFPTLVEGKIRRQNATIQENPNEPIRWDRAHPAAKLRGAGLITTAALLSISMTA